MITEEQKKERLNKDCHILVEGILNKLESQPEAILLCGGYGRGEGAWFEDNNGEASPYNDYDVAVITEKPLPRNVYTSLRKELATTVGINWVDIDCYTQSQLERMRPTIHNVDLLYASTVLWGNKEWATKFRRLDSAKIGKEDIIRLYVTRIWTLLGSLTEEERDLDISETRFFCNQMAKAVLAGCDMRLVANNKYTVSYKERARLVSVECLSDPSEIELCSWAINEKLNPSTQKMTINETKVLYDRVYIFFVDSFRYAMHNEADYYLNPQKTNHYLLFRTRYIPLVVYSWMRGNKKIKKSYDVMRAQNYVFRAYSNSGNYNTLYLRRACDILMHYHYINDKTFDWRKLCLTVANARNNV